MTIRIFDPDISAASAKRVISACKPIATVLSEAWGGRSNYQYANGIVEIVLWRVPDPLNRYCCNVQQDVTTLIEWLVIEKDESGKVFAPWDDIDVQLPTPCGL